MVKQFLESISFTLLITLLWIFNRFPLRWRHWFVLKIITLYAKMFPRFEDTCLRNLRLVYPLRSLDEIRTILYGSYVSLSRFIVDTARYHELDQAWVKEHIECPFKERYLEIKKRAGGKGVLTASGHLGSIELQALAAPFVGRKFSFIARSLNHSKLDSWWRKNREQFGNQVILRKGAVQQALKNINEGIDVAILIDQNVRREYALFVDWFGRPAATTFAFGHVAVATECPVVISAITYVGNEKYRVLEHECDMSSIYGDAELSVEEKVFAVTKKVSAELQTMILANPTEWFWMHRRWKTTPLGMAEDFYTKEHREHEQNIAGIEYDRS